MNMPGQIQDAVDTLTRKSQDHVDRLLQNLVEENIAAGGSRKGFIFGGAFHTLENPKTISASERKPLCPELFDAALTYTREKELCKKEKVRLTHGLSAAISPCQNFQQVRDQLPDLCQELIPELQGRPRTQPVGYLFQNAPIKMYDFRNTVKLLKIYWADRLVI